MTADTYSLNARRMAAVIALMAFASLVTRIVLRMQEFGSFWEAISFLTQFFTILTNMMILFAMMAVASGRNLSLRLARALAVWITIVGIVYHLLLAHLVNFTGISRLADHGVHTVVPLLTVLWWLFFVRHPRPQWLDVVVWISFPILYCLYVLLRAVYSGFYPYPFLNLPELGAQGFITSVAGLAIGFFAVGVTFVMLERAIARFRRE